ncbi:putative ABC transport system ATP-binding protein [Yoonia sediminilitoris]|uniref:Putative ABC transport system ATP-binding protein n=1 Tax=Yoonia sediminilitoris TaxID=1286148 RepID=A0A2T6K8P3_9RHOB|nr:putative ABC transport system ATP-binding protein [Yoonia sediminilitoris]RCW91017.1 putative ABC transport system ATP-binding protein [Yoonia sediminilitoris]
MLKGVSLKIRAGEFVAIMGPSGSGKTTLMNLLGLLDTPSGGRLCFEGQNVTRLKPDEQAAIRNSRMGFVFQSYNLLPRLTAIENVELPLIYARVGRGERVERARRMLAAVGLADRSEHWPNQLSGGEQQRVSIARAMVSRPALVLADEPTGALDTRTGANVMSLLKEMIRQGTTVVLVTHDESVAQHAERTIRLFDGKLCAPSHHKVAVDAEPFLLTDQVRKAAE